MLLFYTPMRCKRTPSSSLGDLILGELVRNGGGDIGDSDEEEEGGDGDEDEDGVGSKEGGGGLAEGTSPMRRLLLL